MTNLNDVLLAMSNIPVDDPIAETWGRGLQGGGYTIIEYTGALPLTFKANGEPLIDYRIYGNTVQTGTPTPENPIIPIGCGELETTGIHAGQYKLPILSNSTVTNIYLGEVETTRRIKKFVLTGTNADGNANITAQGVIFITPTTTLKNVGAAYCTHFKYVNRNQGSGIPDNSFTTNGGAGTSLWFKTNYTSVADFKSYLQQQYAAGTPVTVWYVLAEPETGIVNEPLMKIGDYADTISMEQASVNIPTNKGTTIIDYDGTLKPSQMYIKYLGVKK